MLSVTADCDADTEFACTNGRCILFEKVNNTVNDCEDNSDEGECVHELDIKPV